MFQENFCTQQIHSPDPHPQTEQSNPQLQEEAEALMEVSITHLPASAEKVKEYCRSQREDPVSSTVNNYCQKGWPEKNTIQTEILSYGKLEAT